MIRYGGVCHVRWLSDKKNKSATYAFIVVRNMWCLVPWNRIQNVHSTQSSSHHSVRAFVYALDERTSAVVML